MLVVTVRLIAPARMLVFRSARRGQASVLAAARAFVAIRGGQGAPTGADWTLACTGRSTSGDFLRPPPADLARLGPVGSAASYHGEANSGPGPHWSAHQSSPPADTPAAPPSLGEEGGGLMFGKLLTSVRELVSALAGDSELARGGLTLALAGAAAATARLAAGALVEYARRKMLVRAEIDSRDDAYRWMMFWLMRQSGFCSSPFVSVTTTLKAFGTSPIEESAMQLHTQGNGTRKFMLIPAPGDHWMRYRGSWVLISRERAKGNPQIAANARLMMETLRITAPANARNLIVDMLEDARMEYEASQAQRTAVYTVDPYQYWTKVGSRPVRPLSSVVLPDGKAEALLADCREFLAGEAWYAHRGIPYRRGYLLYGLPGTGKTSLVTALAGELGCHLYVVSLNSPKMTDEALAALLTSSEEGSILLLEDVDAAFVQRDRVGGGGGSDSGGLSFSGLLNAIDGVAAQEGRMLFMTTNHIERLNDALIRPGRVDVRVEFSWATEVQKERLFIAFYQGEAGQPGTDGMQAMSSSQQLAEPGGLPGDNRGSRQRSTEHCQAKQFVKNLGGAQIAMAELQGYLMKHKDDPQGAVENYQALLGSHAR